MSDQQTVVQNVAAAQKKERIRSALRSLQVLVDDLGQTGRLSTADVLRRIRKGEAPKPKVVQCKLMLPNLSPGKKVLTPEVILKQGSKVQMRGHTWIWTGWLAIGMLHNYSGAPGTGKTTTVINISAAISVGGTMPDGSICHNPGSTVMWSGEDGIEDTLAPRFVAAGANMDKIYFITGACADGEDRAFDPARDFSALEDKIRQIGDVRLIVIDSIVSVVKGDNHKNNEVRRDLQCLVDLAQRVQCAVVGISHLTKGSAGKDPAERVTGSVAHVALARIVWVAVRCEDPEPGEPTRMLAVAKSNIGLDHGGIGYDVCEAVVDDSDGNQIKTTNIVWTGAIEGRARDILEKAEARSESESHSSSAEAAVWLESVLAVQPLDRGTIHRMGQDQNFSEKTLRNAREKLGLLVEQRGFGSHKKSMWILPGHAAHDPKMLGAM